MILYDVITPLGIKGAVKRIAKVRLETRLTIGGESDTGSASAVTATVGGLSVHPTAVHARRENEKLVNGLRPRAR